jgi:hypothetical protein
MLVTFTLTAPHWPVGHGRRLTAMSHQTEDPILQQIHDLVAEEKHLRSTHTGIGLNQSERMRLDGIERQLDQCWTLLRQRRADDDLAT